MAGFQQAANALTGSFGAVAGRVGVYSELVGKNKEQREQLAKQNEELEKQNEDLENKNKLIEQQYNNLKAAQEAQMEQSQQMENLAKRIYSNQRARASRDLMIDAVYGDKSTGNPIRDFAKEQLKREREQKEGGK